MAAQVENQQKIATVWEGPYTFGGKDKSYELITACKKNNLKIVQQLIGQCNLDAFDLMCMVINGNCSKLETWNFIMPLLTREDATKTFLCYEQKQHTLLSYCCSRNYYGDEKIMKYKIASLLELGSQWDQVIHDQKTALTFLVTCNFILPVLRWCIEETGANPHHGHLLVYASNGITKEDHVARAEAHRQYELYSTPGGAPMAEPEESSRCRPYKNNDTFSYLLELGLDVEDTLDSGMTPFLAACSECQETNVQKVQGLLGKGASIYKKMNDGVDAWYWAEEYRYMQWGSEDFVYYLRDLLLQHEREQSVYWTTVLDEVVHDPLPNLLQEVPFRELISFFAK